MNDTTLFQYCQKLVVFNEAQDSVLLAKRKGEADYDGTFSFIGGKMETTDKDIIEGLRREKTEEIGADATVEVYPLVSYNVFFRKNDGNSMILPHYYAVFRGGEIILNDEYSEYEWVKISELDDFEPKIFSIPTAAEKVMQIKKTFSDSELVKL